MESTTTIDEIQRGDPRVNRIGFADPWRWLALGCRDTQTAPLYSLRYGAAIVLLSGLIIGLTLFAHLSFLIPFLTAGFFLVAPLLAIGLYQMRKKPGTDHRKKPGTDHGIRSRTQALWGAHPL